MFGVWQGIPYLFSDFIGSMCGISHERRRSLVAPKSAWYRGFLCWIAFPPLSLLIWDKPVQLIVLYSVLSALFMPFLAGTLLYMNSRRDWVGAELSNRWPARLSLLLCLALFGYLGLSELSERLGDLILALPRYSW